MIWVPNVEARREPASLRIMLIRDFVRAVGEEVMEVNLKSATAGVGTIGDLFEGNDQKSSK